jgi:hypothetical protein
MAVYVPYVHSLRCKLILERPAALQSSCDEVPLHAELRRSTLPKAAKPRSGKSDTVPVIQAPRVRLPHQPLRKVAITSSHQTDKANSEAPYPTTGKVSRKRSCRPDHGVWWGSRHWRSSATHAADERGAREGQRDQASSLILNLLAAISTASRSLARVQMILRLSAS